MIFSWYTAVVKSVMNLEPIYTTLTDASVWVQYVTSQYLQDLTNANSTCSFNEDKHRPMPADTDRGNTLIGQNLTNASDPRCSLRKLFDWHLLTLPIYLTPMWWLACWEILTSLNRELPFLSKQPWGQIMGSVFWSVALCEKLKVTWRVLIIFSFPLVVLFWFLSPLTSILLCFFLPCQS